MLTVREILNTLNERIATASEEQKKAKWTRKTVHTHPNHNEWVKDLSQTKYRYSVENRAGYISALLAFHHEIRGQEEFQNHENQTVTPYCYYRELTALRAEFCETLQFVQAEKAA